MILRKYRFWCNDESVWVSKWDFDSTGITCPNNVSHSVDTTDISIVDNIPEKLEGIDDYFTEYTYYVDGTNGSDQNDGSETYPFKTIQYAISSRSKISDNWVSTTIKIKPGTYNLNQSVLIDGFKNIRVILRSSTDNADDVLIVGASDDSAVTLSNNMTTVALVNLSIKCQGNDAICVRALNSLFVKLSGVKLGDDGLSSNTVGFFTNCTSNSVTSCYDIDTNKVTYGLKSTCNKLIIVDDVSNFSETLVYPGTYYINYSEYQDAIDKRHFENHELDTHIDVPTKPTTGNKLLECVQGTFQWSPTPDLNSVGLRGITVNVVHPNQDYEEEEDKSWVILASFVFPGHDILNASIFEIVASRNGSVGLSACRLYDFTNNNQIAYIEWSNEEKARYLDNSLTNLPQSSPAIFEVQIKRISGSKTRFHASTLR